jgi:hypothetical protein
MSLPMQFLGMNTMAVVFLRKSHFNLQLVA